MVFEDVVIPMGTNALFIDCTFVGVTRVEAYQDNTHPSWIFYGHEQLDPEAGTLSLTYPPPPAESDAQLDKSYADPAQPGYDELPDPLFVPIDLDGDGTANDQVINTKRISNNIRFHDCLFVGSIVADKPAVFHAVRSKLQFTGATVFTDTHPAFPDDPAYNPDSDALDEIAKSSMMLPNYSVDVGTNNSPPEQDVRLSGAIIAGVLDVRGNAEIEGAILSTFEPGLRLRASFHLRRPGRQPGELQHHPGRLRPDDGDGEGLDLSDLTDLDGDGVEDIGWDSARDASGALIPVDSWSGAHDDAWYDGVPDDDAQIDPGQYVRRAIPFEGHGKVRACATTRTSSSPTGSRRPCPRNRSPAPTPRGASTSPATDRWEEPWIARAQMDRWDGRLACHSGVNHTGGMPVPREGGDARDAAAPASRSSRRSSPSRSPARCSPRRPSRSTRCSSPTSRRRTPPRRTSSRGS